MEQQLATEDDLTAAIAEVDRLIDRDHLDPEESDRLDRLGDQIARYDRRHHPMGGTTDAEMLRHLMEAHATTPTAVACAAGIALSTVSAVLRGHRRLTRHHIQVLAMLFRVSPSVFFD